MGIRRFRLKDCSVGDIIGEDIFTESGIMIVPIGTPLTEFLVKKLSDFGVENLLIDEQEVEITDFKKEVEAIKKSYVESAENVKDILHDLAIGKVLQYDRVNTVSDSLYTEARSTFGVIECLNELKNVDNYTYCHSVNVSLYALLMGKWMNMDEVGIKNLVTAGLLHDVGKAAISDSIINKKGGLTAEEFEEMKKHPLIGYNMVKDIAELNNDVKLAVLMHHEKESGKGYPFGVVGDKINLFSKIIAISDVYDALTSARSYKKRMTPFQTFSEFEKIGIGSGSFDPTLLLKFLSNISSYYMGMSVKLDTGDIGKVVYIPPTSISTPIIQVGDIFIDLYTVKNVNIVEMI